MTCRSPISAAAARGQLHSAMARRMDTPTAAPCTPAVSTQTQPRQPGDAAMALASIRRRLAHPEPGSVHRLRADQRAALHAILAGRP